MGNRELILDFLGEVSPGKICDDCLSEELDIYPRQQVNQICHRLADEKNVNRDQGVCSSCHKSKIVNFKGGATNMIKESVLNKRYVPDFKVNLYEVRKKIMAVCKDLWIINFNNTPPSTLPALVNPLKHNEIIPPHQANMMLTLNGLRNSFDHDGLVLGEEEILIANNAWKIVDKWLREKQRINEG